MKCPVLTCGLLFLVTLAAAQEDFSAVHRDDFERWSRVTGIPAAQIERMWQQTSHYANSADDDSSIELVDVRSLRARDQILMITTAGIPRCLNVAVFWNQKVTFPKLWQVDQGLDGNGFCDKDGIPAEVNATKDGIVITTPITVEGGDRDEVPKRKYFYRWNGNTYSCSAELDTRHHSGR